MKYIPVSVRLSCPALVSLQDEEGKYALLINRACLQKGERVFTPIGGGLQVFPEGLQFLERLGAHGFRKKHPFDMVFYLPEQNLQDVIDWFNQRTQRECTPIAEIYQELTMEEETKLLQQEDLEKSKVKFLGSSFQVELPTIRMAEIHHVTFPQATMEKLRRASEAPDPVIRFFSEAEILAGESNGETIGSVSKLILPRFIHDSL
ncbi:hypothetical protein [Shimazuella kribbensis]|uniref:SMODS-associated NUDIX domain-containing protein n=1 Tax=Shimazuella kribbensis TaxID=139808 RepID=UPI000490D981|nr:hypothetical protein [Shimazuella kribbensis]